ncbi:MAG: hypothetical protein HOE80_04775 [Candidatus Magasanikbacteria bacterium]|nr:hypothetical protein [Candidatus Magasanikbacteria bacterium]MBT4072004.1 hypothetical protein [Candidatus Magasanikbacteria bacterium]
MTEQPKKFQPGHGRDAYTEVTQRHFGVKGNKEINTNPEKGYVPSEGIADSGVPTEDELIDIIDAGRTKPEMVMQGVTEAGDVFAKVVEGETEVEGGDSFEHLLKQEPMKRYFNSEYTKTGIISEEKGRAKKRKRGKAGWQNANPGEKWEDRPSLEKRIKKNKS